MIDIDRAKGIGIFLVVLGHVVARDFPADNEWYVFLKAVLYKFHMPFFMFLSGIVAAYSYHQISTVQEYLSYVRKKAARLLPAYFLFAAIIFACKVLAQPWLHVDNPVHDPSDFIHALLYPKLGFVAFLWFIWTLFLLQCVTPAYLQLTRHNMAIALAIVFVLQFFHLPELLGLDLMREYFFFFLFGFFVLHYRDWYYQVMQSLWLPLTIAFLATVLTTGTPKYITGLLSIPVIHHAVRQLGSSNWLATILDILARYTFPIYLMNTLAIGFTKALILKVHPWDGPAFLVIAPILLIAGLLIPVLLKVYIFPRIPFLDSITR